MSRSLSARLLLVCVLALSATPALAAGVYSQVVVPFNSPRVFSHAYHKGEHALVLEFQKTAPSEITPFEQYDERLIKRVVIKDLGPAGTEVKLVLRDRDVRAIVNSFQEPFRVTVDLFDADYEEERDPETGLPVVTPAGADASGAVAGDYPSPKLLVAEDGTVHASPKSAAPSHESETHAAGKRRLLQPTPELFANPEEMDSALKGAAEGIGKSWKDYPPYVYRIQTAAYEETERKKKTAPSSVQALSSTEAMADYAGKLYNFGHESKALLAYQQVLHKDPSIFDRDALHLWKFSEVHLGQGNLTLARGYYEALVEKHPESPLASFARVRILDVTAIRLLQQGREAEWQALEPKLSSIKPRHNGELVAQLGIRRAWWGKDAKGYDAKRLPQVNPAVAGELTTAYPQVESSRTAFLAASLLLNDLVRPDTPWQRATGQLAEGYFKRFSGDAAEPFRSNLKEALSTKLNASLQAKVTDGKLVEAIDDYEALPNSLRTVKGNPKTAWALAEAYRKLSQTEKSVDLYAAAAKTGDDGPDRFKAEFWLAVTAGELAASLKKSSGNQDKIGRYARQSQTADKSMDGTWGRLKAEERQGLVVSYKDHFEKTITAPAKLRTPPKLVLQSWTNALSTKSSATTGGSTGASELAGSFSPSGTAVILLSDLGKRFAELGLPTERRQAIRLLERMTPKELEDDKAAKALWANQLVALAEDYRKANQYLDAGRLFSLVGDGAENWEGRAESLYKGGLLLYRAGRREEATAAFQKAADDGNNTFYANLAKERLAQLE